MVLGWTEDDGAMNAGPPHVIQSEEDIKLAIGKLAAALSDKDFSELFSLYPVQDFEARSQDYEAAKQENDPAVSVHWFRASQIVRDILFTCSSIDFGSEMSKHSQLEIGENHAGVWLYTLNQSMLTPLWKGAGMSHIGVAHGSDSNYLFNLFPEGEIAGEDQVLAEELMSAFIQFATTGNPNTSKARYLKQWPKAFHARNSKEVKYGSASFHVQVVGEHRSIAAQPQATSKDDEVTAEIAGEYQQVLGYEVGAMKSARSSAADNVVARQKLLERCAFVNSLSEKLGS